MVTLSLEMIAMGNGDICSVSTACWNAARIEESLALQSIEIAVPPTAVPYVVPAITITDHYISPAAVVTIAISI